MNGKNPDLRKDDSYTYENPDSGKLIAPAFEAIPACDLRAYAWYRRATVREEAVCRGLVFTMQSCLSQLESHVQTGKAIQAPD